MSDKLHFCDLTVAAIEPMTFEPIMLEDVTVTLLDEEHILPAVKHPQYDVVTSLYAVVIKLHQRVQVLEAELTSSVAANGEAKGGKDE